MSAAADFLLLIDDCEKRESRLSDWERTFLDSLRGQIERGSFPSKKQSDILDEIWNKATLKG